MKCFPYRMHSVVLNSWVQVNWDEIGNEDDLSDRAAHAAGFAELTIKQGLNESPRTGTFGGDNQRSLLYPIVVGDDRDRELKGQPDSGWREKVLALKPGRLSSNQAVT